MIAKPAILSLVALTALCGSAQATALFNSLGDASTGLYGIANTADGPEGASFSTQGSSVSNLQVQISAGLVSAANGGSFMIFLANNLTTGGAHPDTNPSDALAMLASSVSDSSLSTSSLETLSYTTHLSSALTANTRYWIVLEQNVNGTNAGWSGATNYTGTGVASEYYYAPGFGGAGPNTNGPFNMAVNDMGVPEPGSLSVLGIGLLGLATIVRRRRKAC